MRAKLLLVPSLLLLAGACRTRPAGEPWVVDGERLGSIATQVVPGGRDVRFLRDDGQLARLEMLTNDDVLVAVDVFEYDDDGELVRILHQDGSGELRRGDEGYAVTEIHRRETRDGLRVEEHRYLDRHLRPTACDDGYARKELHHRGDRLVRVRLLDPHGHPVAATFLGVRGTAGVDYAYLRGAEPLVYGVFRDPGGAVLEKLRLSGETHLAWSTGLLTGGAHGGAYRSYSLPGSSGGGGFSSPAVAPAPAAPRPAPTVRVRTKP